QATAHGLTEEKGKTFFLTPPFTGQLAVFDSCWGTQIAAESFRLIRFGFLALRFDTKPRSAAWAISRVQIKSVPLSGPITRNVAPPRDRVEPRVGRECSMPSGQLLSTEPRPR